MYHMLDDFSLRIANQSLNEEKYLKEKIFCASKSLYQQLNNDNINQDVKRSYNKYLNRSIYRATPFGLFSSIASGPTSGSGAFSSVIIYDPVKNQI